ncbi:chromosome segregation protein Spc25-domain-containing protein [Paraphysoderma sedebokerense]|nr:chromosome segregation protein Spc25-domain-containing protein [Paraphysoderma sedebokerense]
MLATPNFSTASLSAQSLPSLSGGSSLSSATAITTFPYDKLKSQMDNFLSLFDSWLQEKRSEMLLNKQKHLKTMAEDRETVAQIQKKLDFYASKQSELDRVLEKEKQEIEEVTTVIQSLSIQKNSNEQTKQDLKSQIEEVKGLLKRKQDELTNKTSKQNQMMQLTENEIILFSNVLKMRLEPITSGVKIIFTHINDQNWDEEFSFSVEIEGEGFRVTATAPSLPQSSDLENWLNETNDLYGFIKLIRKEFCDFVKRK